MDKIFSVIFCGTPDFAVPALERLHIDPAFDVKLVVTQPDKPVGRRKKVEPSPVKLLAQSLNIPVFQPENINDPASLAHLRDIECDYLIVVAYGQILSKEVLNLPTIAPVNVHGSLLPRWRGASPVEHAILSSDKQTGVTVQIMAQELDAGPILSTAPFPIGARDTALFLREQLSQLGAMLLTETLKQQLKPVVQPSEGVTFCTRLKKEDGLADRSKMHAEEIDRMVRALNPWPGVTCEVNNHTIKLIETSLDPEPRAMPVSCAQDSTLYLLRVQPAGKKEMSADEWRRGLR